MSSALDRPGRLHVLTDPALGPGHATLAAAAAQGGADVVQLRDKRPRTTAELIADARATIAALDGRADLVVNDRVDVVAAVGAAGVHLGRDDLDPATARRLLGPGAWIGATANSLDEALARAAGPIDYLGVGPVFGTISKAHPAPRLGLDALRAICRRVRLPVIAIGSIAPHQVGVVLEAGAHGVAVLSGVACQPDPAAACRRYRDALDAALARRTVDER